MNPKMSFRFAQPEDAPAFAAWAASNPQIDRKDLEAGMAENNSTATFLVIEEEVDGVKVPRLFMPVYLTMRIAYLGFNPENDREKNLEALETMLPNLTDFARFWKVNEIDVITKREIPIAQWAAAHDFKPEERELYTLKLLNPNAVTISPEEETL
jgi:hypothetical protein